MNSMHALLVGVGQRPDDKPSIGVTATDAERVSKELIEKCGISTAHINVLTSKEASRDNIIHKLDMIIDQTKNQQADLVILFFSGHGVSKDKFGYLINYDADQAKLDSTAIGGDDFVAKINEIDAKSVLVLLNCCHSGGVLGGEYRSTDIPFDKSSFLKKPNRAIITACTSKEFAYVSKPVSVYTFALIKGLAGMGLIHGDKKYVTLFDLAMYIREEVVWLSNGKQHPELEVLNQAKTENFVIVNYENGIPQPIDDQFGGLYDELNNQLNVQVRGIAPTHTDEAFRKRFEWLEQKVQITGSKNVIVNSQISVAGDFHVGDNTTRSVVQHGDKAIYIEKNEGPINIE